MQETAFTVDDVGIAIQNATVAAESLGLGTVDIGAVRIKILEIAKELNLPLDMEEILTLYLKILVFHLKKLKKFMILI